MTYKEFIINLPLANDPTINWVIQYVQSDLNFPDTMDVETIARYLYKKLNEKQTLAFQKSLLLYFEDSGNLEMTKYVNKIVKLQDGDPEYSI